MRIDNRLLALLMAATLGTVVVGCQREEGSPRAAGESTQPPMANAPSTREAPSTGISGPAGAPNEQDQSAQPAAPTDQPQLKDEKMKESGGDYSTQPPSQR